MIRDTQSSDLNQMIHKCTQKSRSKSNDSKYAIWSPDLNQMICDAQSDWSALKQWHILQRKTDCEFRKLHYYTCFLKLLQAMSKFKNEWLIWSGFC